MASDMPEANLRPVADFTISGCRLRTIRILTAEGQGFAEESCVKRT